MSLNYKGYNFIIYEPDTKLSSGAYFNITNYDDDVYATMLKDINFSTIDKGDYNYEIYLARGNLYSAIKKIKEGSVSRYKLCSFVTNDYHNLFSDNISISFSEHECDEGLFLSNPIITFKRKFLDRFIDNL